MFTPSKPTGSDFIDVTILNTPQPQATSTVQRKSTLESKFFDQDIADAICRQSKRTSIQSTERGEKHDESSLGLLNNLSSYNNTHAVLAEVSGVGDLENQNDEKLETEREFARKLLQRCSDIRSASIVHDTDKENNANIQNLSSNYMHGLMDENKTLRATEANHEDDNTLQASADKTSSVVFEPNEISARSSGLSRSSKKDFSLSSSSKNLNTITFDSTTAELMAQFNNEEFHPASEMASQMLADEASWQQNYSYALPIVTSAEKEYLNLSCFSGIIGELDLSVESCAGRKVSIGEFFKRKCGNFGELSDDAVERPSLGLSISSPKKKGQLIPLVDSTVVSEESSVGSYVSKDKTEQNIPNTTKDIEEQSIMSLTSIAQALQDIDNSTPRRLVDQLIMAKKKRKPMQIPEDKPVRDTYTLLPCQRKSMPATPSRNLDNMKSDIGLSNLSNKLSLDSKPIKETIDTKYPIPKMLSFNSNADAKTSFEIACQELKKEISNGNLPGSNRQDFKSLLEDPKLTLPHYAMEKKANCAQEVNSTPEHDHTPVDLEQQLMENKDNVKEENISYKDNTESFMQDLSNFQGSQSQSNNVIIGKSTEELCNCVVGMSRDTDIELVNKSDRWVICSLSVNQVQGDKHNVRLTLPKDVVLIKPNSQQRAKIAVRVVKMSKPIIAVINVTVSDMVTRSEWTIKHIMCFKPEEIDINISHPSEDEILDFHCVAETTVSTLPVTIKNNNSVDVPVILSLLQDAPTAFSFENSDELERVTLKSHELYTTSILCKGVSQKKPEQSSSQRCSGTLIIQAGNTSEDITTIKEVPLVAQIGSFKIQVIDTVLPLTINNKQGKPLSVINLGSMPVLISAAFVEDSEFPTNSKYFIVQPENLFLQPNETGCFLITFRQQSSDAPKVYARVKLTAGNSVYHYSVIGESNTYTEAENENFLRCETPQYLSSVSSPSSPHSVISNKSTISGRNSPISTASGSTVAGDKIPIRTTHAALVWNSTKVGKSEIKEFTIRNTSNNKIKIQAVIADSEQNFRFLRERQAVGTTIILVLQGSESRTLSVVFNPRHLGAAMGKIVFRHYEPRRDENESRPSKVLFLYGYGGYSRVEISEAFKDTTGKMWLSLGTLSSGGSLDAKIKLQNLGDLCSYVKIKLTPKAVYPTMVSSWQVSPSELLLNPKETQWVNLEFQPRKDDLALLQRANVSHVGTLLVTHGDEPTRWRIRRLYNKIKETGELNGNENEAFRNIVHPICKAFPGEQLVSDINIIRDSVQNLGDLCRGIGQYEIMLTMEVCADESLSILHDNADESQMFYSLCSDSSHICEGTGESFLPSETMLGNCSLQNYMNAGTFTVSPSIVVLTPPTRTDAIVTIKSSCTVAQPFETSLSNQDYLSVLPSEGMIPTRRDFQLRVQCKRKIERNINAVLEIYTENNKLDVQIRVHVKRL